MSKQPIMTGIVLMALLAVGIVLFFQFGEKPIDETLSQNKPFIRPPAAKSDGEDGLQRKRPALVPKQVDRKELSDGIEVAAVPSAVESQEAPSIAHPRYVEEIKEQVYEREIDSVDEIPLLDELVQTGDRDTREFWGDGWTSVDDWKKEENGFLLEKRPDGTMVFQPDAETASKYTFFQSPQTYVYDEKNREFVNEVDYYGKTIYNVVKFINDDVLAMMTISGRKVDLNLYQKNANEGVGAESPEQARARSSGSRPALGSGARGGAIR